MLLSNFTCVNFLSAIDGRDKCIYIGLSSHKALLPTLNYVGNSTLWQVQTLVEATAVDLSVLKTSTEGTKRFLIIYILTSMSLNYRVAIFFKHSINEPVFSVSVKFKSTRWSEREMYENFSLYFAGNDDLRYLLMDYGFQGFPLLKDFPLSGFLEKFYNEMAKQIISKPIGLMQACRAYSKKKLEAILATPF